MFVTFLTYLQPKESSQEEDANKCLNSNSASMMTYSDCEEDDVIPISNVVNKRMMQPYIINFMSLKKV